MSHVGRCSKHIVQGIFCLACASGIVDGLSFALSNCTIQVSEWRKTDLHYRCFCVVPLLVGILLLHIHCPPFLCWLKGQRESLRTIQVDPEKWVSDRLDNMQRLIGPNCQARQKMIIDGSARYPAFSYLSRTSMDIGFETDCSQVKTSHQIQEFIRCHCHTVPYHY